MHEYSIARALLDRVEAEARARAAVSVRRLTVRVGDLSGVDRDLLASAFETIRENTICAGADLRIVPVAIAWICPACGEGVARGDVLRCGRCRVPARLAAGNEILLERIEMEVA